MRSLGFGQVVLFLLVALAGGFLVALAGRPAEARRPQDLEGVIDFHCHSGPDVVGRLINDFEIVRQARAAGMRAIVLKNHYTMTADRAQLAMQEVGGIQVFGGITLNLSVGGLNPEAVRKMVQMDGQRGRIVWLPTFDGEAQVRQSGENRPFIPVVKDGAPVPALREILGLIAEHHLILCTGHCSAAESLVIMDAARKLGISKIVVTHAQAVPGGATDEQLRQMAQMGAVIECTWLAQMPGGGKGAQRPITVAEYARVVRLVGAEHVLISSDMGQMANPPHVEAMRAFIAALKREGLSDGEIDRVARKNAAQVLGLEP